MRKKGFTLVELLAVIVVLSIVIVIGINAYQGIRARITEKMYTTKLKDIELAAISWAQKNPNELSEDCSAYEVAGYKPTFCKMVTVTDLVDSGFLETEETKKTTNKYTLTNNTNNQSMMCDEVLIYRKNNRIYATVWTKNSENENYQCNR